MDQDQAYILTKLDLLIERQRDQRLMLERLLAGAVEMGEAAAKPKTLGLISRLRHTPPFFQSLMAGGVIWTFGLSVKSFLDHGGKPLELIELLLKYLL